MKQSFIIEVEIEDNWESEIIALESIDNILEDISKTYNEKKTKQQLETIQKMSPEQLITVRDLLDMSGVEIIRQITYKDKKSRQECKLNHVRVYQQFVPNACGYHASFNMLSVLEAVKMKSEIRFISSSEYYKFKREVVAFLWQYKQNHHPDNQKWPWRHHDIFEGDFERIFLKICLQNNQKFITLLQSDEDITILYHTWEFQFGRILHSEQDQKELQLKMNSFTDFNPDIQDSYNTRNRKNKSIIFAIMLGITNHWCTFIAQKNSQGVEFFFLDSRNRDYLQWNDSQIQEWIQQQIQRRKSMGLSSWSEFDLQVQTTCVKDIQDSLNILCECLLGNMTLQHFHANSSFLLFEIPFKKVISYEDVLAKRNIDKSLSACHIYAREFYQSVQLFFRTPIFLQLLTPQNREKLSRMIVIFTELQKQNKLINAHTYFKSHIEPLHNLLLKASL